MYHENGKISEEGTWRTNRWVGTWKLFDSIGNVQEEFTFDTVGKREGPQIIKLDNDQTAVVGKFSTGHGTIKEYNEQGDTLPNSPIILNGKHTLYNTKKQITKEGIFKNNQFMEGKAYLYDENGILIRVSDYKYGKYVDSE